MDNNVVEMDKLTDETKKKMRDFDEQEAYFLLCEIFSYAQATKDYAKFQADLTSWKSRYPIDLFSDDLKRKIKYMLSKEFLDTVLKNFSMFDELSKKDPAKGLEKLRKVFSKAEKHKDEDKLDKDLAALYKEYPLDFLKQKYPHIVSMLTSKSYRTKVLTKFDSSLAFKELTNITENPENFENAEAFKSALDEYQKLYPVGDFNEKFKSQVEENLKKFSDEKELSKLFPVSEFDLNVGQVIPLDLHKSISIREKDALHDLHQIVKVDVNDIDGLFNWTCKYAKYINSFDSSTKDIIVKALMLRYKNELPTSANFRVPDMDCKGDDLLSKKEFGEIYQTKRNTVLQVLCMLNCGQDLTHDDVYRLQTINRNNEKAKIIENAAVDYQLFCFMEDKEEEELTFDNDNLVYLNPVSTSSGGEGVVLTLEKENVRPDKTEVEEVKNATVETRLESENANGFDEKVDDESENISSAKEPELTDTIQDEVEPAKQSYTDEPDTFNNKKGFGKFFDFFNRGIKHDNEKDRDDER